MIRSLISPLSFFVLLLCANSIQAANLPEPTVSAALNYKSVTPNQKAAVAIVLDVPPGYHIQSHTPNQRYLIPFVVTIDPNPALIASDPLYPKGEDHEYPMLGKLNVYTGRVIAYVPIQIKPDAQPGPLKITGAVRYQMCDDKTCFSPQKPAFQLEANIAAASEPNPSELFQNYVAPVSGTTQPATGITEAPGKIPFFGWEISLTRDAWLVPFACAFLVGIIFNVMPCVLPVVPLKAMGFYEVSQHNRARSFALGLVFSLGIVASFAALGLLVIAKQAFKWGELFSNTWFLLGLVVVLVVMALSTFGVFDVKVPTWLYSVDPRHDTYTGNFLFGILTAALSTPCTFGMFFGLLAWALTQPVAIGVGLLIMVGVGMAFPYLLLSAFPELARKLPRTGPWAETIKMLMGFLLLGTAAYFAGPFIARALGPGSYWWVVFAIVLAAAIFLVWRTIRFSKGFVPRAVAVVIALAMILPTLYTVRLLTARPYEWKPFTPEALAAAQSAGKIVLVDFTADWCGNCHFLEAFVLNSRRVVKTVDDHQVVMLKADVTDEKAPGRPLLNELTPVGAIPLTAIYGPGLQQPIQLTGIYTVKDLQDAIAQTAATTSSTRNPS